MTRATALTIAVDESCTVSGILQAPAEARACYVMAHGAGAGMNHSFMAAVADGLAGRNIATLRYQFPYMERGSRRPDSPALAHRTVRAAVIEAARQLPALPLIAGGKSFGGRMTSQAQAEAPLPKVEGLAFFGFPLHPANKPSVTRAEHLSQIQIPMLFLQGTRDALADMTLLAQTINIARRKGDARRGQRSGSLLSCASAIWPHGHGSLNGHARHVFRLDNGEHHKSRRLASLLWPNFVNRPQLCLADFVAIARHRKRYFSSAASYARGPSYI